MKTAETFRASTPATIPKVVPLALSSSSKIELAHLDRLTIV